MVKPENKNHKASLLIRSGLAIVFTYAAITSLVSPQEWMVYLPPVLAKLSDPHTLVRMFAVYELVLAALLISGKYIKWVGAASALTFLAVILSNLSLLDITFRDIALLFSSLALIFLDD